MELILLSVFGTALLFLLELCGFLHERWVRDPHLRGPEPGSAPSINQPGRLMASQFLPCSEAANDADATTIVRVRSRRTLCDSTAE
jgi:hypothetical protein